MKTIKSGSNHELVASQEIQAAACVRDRPHPCLVELFAVFQSKESCTFSLVMEFCPEGNLHQKIVKARSAAVERCETYTAPAQAPRWLAHIFLGLEHVHLQLHMLFRDLKPGNVVFSADGCAKLTDFGLSRFGLESDGNWTFGFPAGSPGYASPEVMLGEEYDARADLSE